MAESICDRCALPSECERFMGGAICSLCMGEFAVWWGVGMRAVRPNAPRVGMGRVRAEAPRSDVMTAEELVVASSALVRGLRGGARHGLE